MRWWVSEADTPSARRPPFCASGLLEPTPQTRGPSCSRSVGLRPLIGPVYPFEPTIYEILRAPIQSRCREWPRVVFGVAATPKRPATREHRTTTNSLDTPTPRFVVDDSRLSSREKPPTPRIPQQSILRRQTRPIDASWVLSLLRGTSSLGSSGEEFVAA